MAAGNLYYFNATPRVMTLINNNHILNAKVEGVQKSSGYAPTSNSAARVAATKSEESTFGQQNALVVSLTPGGSQEYPVDIDPNEFPLEEDLELYIFYNQVVLVSSTGKARSTVINGSPLSDSEAEALLQGAGADA
jgi:2',3'-cyclic-nucleotide 2'-phosphodiesterase (5'-nucleotidase family)